MQEINEWYDSTDDIELYDIVCLINDFVEQTLYKKCCIAFNREPYDVFELLDDYEIVLVVKDDTDRYSLIAHNGEYEIDYFSYANKISTYNALRALVKHTEIIWPNDRIDEIHEKLVTSCSTDSENAPIYQAIIDDIENVEISSGIDYAIN